MTLHWVPGHVGVEGTEKAEDLARKGASTLLVGIELFCGLGGAFFKEELKTFIHLKIHFAFDPF